MSTTTVKFVRFEGYMSGAATCRKIRFIGFNEEAMKPVYYFPVREEDLSFLDPRRDWKVIDASEIKSQGRIFCANFSSEIGEANANDYVIGQGPLPGFYKWKGETCKAQDFYDFLGEYSGTFLRHTHEVVVLPRPLAYVEGEEFMSPEMFETTQTIKSEIKHLQWCVKNKEEDYEDDEDGEYEMPSHVKEEIKVWNCLIEELEAQLSELLA